MARAVGNTLGDTTEFAVIEGSARAAEPAPWISDALGRATSDAPVPVALRPGDAVPGTRYVIERWLGDGGMGVVYAARHIDIDRKVAIKILRHEYCKRPTIIAQFRGEARIVQRIGSEHIAEVHDFAELPDGRLMFVMDLLIGHDAASELVRGPLEPPRVVAIMRQVCKALSAAHAAGVVHRDLKPDNLQLCVQRGRADFVKVLDFGIATVMSDASVAAHLAAGTPCYLAPEMIIEGRVAPSVDIYAAGCTAYELLVGEPPFIDDQVEQVLRAHLDREPVPPCERRPEIPVALSAVVMRCLAKDPALRYADMDELEAALCEAQISARMHTTWDDLPLPDVAPERRDALLRHMPDPNARIAPRRVRGLLIGGAVAMIASAGLAALLLSRPADTRGHDEIETLVIAAHEAAARSYFVYPPPGAPDSATAFTVVREIERRGDELGSAADEAARRLRREFAGTLVRLGDDYWERAGGRPFAVDYYAEALVFDPEHDHARERALLTPGQLATLSNAAENRDFTPAELAAAEPLIALAEPDADKRAEKVAALRRDDTARSLVVSDALDRLVAPTRPAPRPARATTPPPAVAPVEPPPAAITPTPAPADEPAEVRDPAAAAASIERGNQARARGQLAAASQAFERALVLDNRSAAALIGLSDVEFDRGAYGRAASFARRAVKLAPRNADYRVRLGDAYFKAYRYDDAIAAYREAQTLGHAAAAARIAKVEAKR